jgi:rhamnosyltransferase
MEEPPFDVVVRSRNEMPFAGLALARLRKQRGCLARIVFFDCGSTDGSRQEAEKHGLRIIHVEPTTYRPGAVLNRAMEATTSPIVAFVSADAIPLSERSLADLVAPFRDAPTLAATYGRQVARSGASVDAMLDGERALGDVGVAVRHGTYLSMAASAVRRDAWDAQPFDESLRCSEDVEWITRLRLRGWVTHYAAGAMFEHFLDDSLLTPPTSAMQAAQPSGCALSRIRGRA